MCDILVIHTQKHLITYQNTMTYSLTHAHTHTLHSELIWIITVAVGADCLFRLSVCIWELSGVDGGGISDPLYRHKCQNIILSTPPSLPVALSRRTTYKTRCTHTHVLTQRPGAFLIEAKWFVCFYPSNENRLSGIYTSSADPTTYTFPSCFLLSGQKRHVERTRAWLPNSDATWTLSLSGLARGSTTVRWTVRSAGFCFFKEADIKMKPL